METTPSPNNNQDETVSRNKPLHSFRLGRIEFAMFEGTNPKTGERLIDTSIYRQYISGRDEDGRPIYERVHRFSERDLSDLVKGVETCKVIARAHDLQPPDQTKGPELER